MDSTPSNPIELTPPEALKPIAPEAAEGLIRLKPETLQNLDERVTQFLDIILKEPAGSDAFRARIEGVHNLANDDIRAAAQVSNRLLNQPSRNLQGQILDESSPVSSALLELRKTIESLDPARQGDLLAPRKLLGIIPMGNRLTDYFRRFETAQNHLDGILKSLLDGQDALRKDNAALEEEKLEAWTIMERLEQYIYIGRQVDHAVEVRLESMQTSDPERAKILQEEFLFYLRQKIQDLLTQLAVTVQGYLAMEVIRKNNIELIKGVDRATTTTLSALRTAVIVAQALANQRLVLSQVSALNRQTGDLIASTSEMLREQAGAIQHQAVAATLDLDQLKTAFGNIYATLDLVAGYKLKALATMQSSIETLTRDIEQARSRLDTSASDPLAKPTVSPVENELKI
jgi:uncharacterized protein YaaN involved in tellurite resistance